jgi:hypothetical protein
MSKGLGSIKKKRVLKAREKQTQRKAAKKLEKFVQALPKISEVRHTHHHRSHSSLPPHRRKGKY